jgi:6-pyruvoyltetrahydropterin/6-carboxytetrahydropterin synthase
MEIFREFTFDAAHRLNHLPEGHKCARVHGHTYRLIVHVTGPLDERLRWIVDFAEIKRLTREVLKPLDHHYLNEVEGLEQPTTENIAMWIWDELKPKLPGLSKLTLWENGNSGCTYTGTTFTPSEEHLAPLVASA